MTKSQNTKHYDLEGTPFQFNKKIIDFVNKLPKTLTNIEIRLFDLTCLEFRIYLGFRN